jgi:hypothetical protein
MYVMNECVPGRSGTKAVLSGRIDPVSPQQRRVDADRT